MQSSSFLGAFKRIESKINVSKTQALNKALSATRVEYRRQVAKALGIKQSTAGVRALEIKANASKLRATLSIGTRVAMAAHEFKPRIVKVGKRKGVTYTVSSKGTRTLGGAFLIKAKSGKKLVMERVSSSRYPIRVKRVNDFQEAVTMLQPQLVSFLGDSFDKKLSEQLRFNLNQV